MESVPCPANDQLIAKIISLNSCNDFIDSSVIQLARIEHLSNLENREHSSAQCLMTLNFATKFFLLTGAAACIGKMSTPAEYRKLFHLLGAVSFTITVICFLSSKYLFTSYQWDYQNDCGLEEKEIMRILARGADIRYPLIRRLDLVYEKLFEQNKYRVALYLMLIDNLYKNLWTTTHMVFECTKTMEQATFFYKPSMLTDKKLLKRLCECHFVAPLKKLIAEGVNLMMPITNYNTHYLYEETPFELFVGCEYMTKEILEKAVLVFFDISFREFYYNCTSKNDIMRFFKSHSIGISDRYINKIMEVI